MKKIKITIPDNLTPQEETFAIAKQLGSKLIENKQGKKLLGSGYEIKHTQTEIIINREPVEKPIKTSECTVCNTTFENSLGSVLYINYGGSRKKKIYCSDNCRDVVRDICGEGRTSIKRSNLKPAFLFK